MDIKFKGKRIDNGEWVEGFYHKELEVDAPRKHYIFEDTTWHIANLNKPLHEVDPATVEIVTPMYKAAEAMYAILKEIVGFLDNDEDERMTIGCHCTETDTGYGPMICAWCRAKEILSKAEGRSE